MGAPQERLLEFRAMGSPCLLRVTGSPANAATADQALQAAMDEVLRIERCFSRYRADSIVSRINACAGRREAVALDTETAGLLRFADQLHRESDGLFDITSGVLRHAWDFSSARLPAPQTLAEALRLVGWQRVEFDGTSIRLPQAGMELDFGGFGKEYAADRAAHLLHEGGWRHGYVNLGGDIRLLGPMPDGTAWRMGVAHPRQAGQVIGGVELLHGALATSGDYERFIEVEGQRHCHIIDPFTGWPVRHWQSVSVLAPACLAAGALSTVAMLKGPEAAEFLQAQGAAWLAVDSDGMLERHEAASASQGLDPQNRT